jgi:hypothetical protein
MAPSSARQSTPSRSKMSLMFGIMSSCSLWEFLSASGLTGFAFLSLKYISRAPEKCPFPAVSPESRGHKWRHHFAVCFALKVKLFAKISYSKPVSTLGPARLLRTHRSPTRKRSMLCQAQNTRDGMTWPESLLPILLGSRICIYSKGLCTDKYTEALGFKRPNVASVLSHRYGVRQTEHREPLMEVRFCPHCRKEYAVSPSAYFADVSEKASVISY